VARPAPPYEGFRWDLSWGKYDYRQPVLLRALLSVFIIKKYNVMFKAVWDFNIEYRGSFAIPCKVLSFIRVNLRNQRNYFKAFHYGHNTSLSVPWRL
jgi:hypothetical protein